MKLIKNIKKLSLGLILISMISATTACAGEDQNQPADNPTPSPIMPTYPKASEVIQPTSTAEIEQGTPSEVKTETVLGDKTVIIWADEGVASSSRGDLLYHASQALGEPNTHLCGDYVTAWQPDDAEDNAWIEVSFSPAILPENILVAQSYFPAQITMIEVTTLVGENLVVYDSSWDEMGDVSDLCPVTRRFSVPEIDKLVNSVRVNLAREADQVWTQIDAVGVEGYVAVDEVVHKPTEEWVEDNGEFYEPHYFTNKNEVNDLLLKDEQLWVGSNGGLIYWDLNNLETMDYVTVRGEAVHALAYCDWELPSIVFAGPQGLTTLLLPYFEEDPILFALDHPGSDQFGKVQTMTCDNARNQLWVGYSGRLSRYDHVSQSWREYSIEDGLPYDAVRKITLIDGDVWVGTASGVAVLWDGETLESFTPENSDLPCQFVHGIVSDEAGVMWMASSCGLISFDGSTWDLWRSEDIDGGMLANVIMGIAVADDGTLWVGDTFGTLCQFEPFSKKCHQVLSPPEDFFLDRLDIDLQGRIALGSLLYGTLLYNEGEWFVLDTKDQLLDNAIRAIAATPDGKLWVASQTGLQNFLFKALSNPWETVELPGDAQPHSLYAGNDGLWIGYTGGASFLPYIEGLDRVDLPLTEGDPQRDNTVTAIHNDGDGLVYLGLSTGLYLWDGNGLRYEDLLRDADRNADVLPPRVNSIYAVEEAVWVGTSKGLFLFVGGEIQQSWIESLGDISSYHANSVGVVTASPRGEGLLVAVGQELFLNKDGAFELVMTLSSEILSMYAGPYQLWVVTTSTGLYTLLMDDYSIDWDSLSQNSQTTSDSYQAVTMTDTHSLWIGTSENGLILLQGLYGQ